ncbi:hypothetical protein [Cohnella sp. GCM10027633]|uniref:hypothetical protein n=1 Tax=unclassified Cohnella TaxID=2636738 RepID=UPI00363F216A
MDNKYNPYIDQTIHTTQPEEPRDELHTREGFNDVLKHYDAVNGFQAPKQLRQIPKSIRLITKWLIILFVVISIVAIIGQIIDVIDHI